MNDLSCHLRDIMSTRLPSVTTEWLLADPVKLAELTAREPRHIPDSELLMLKVQKP